MSSEQLAYATVRLECSRQSGERAYGTGFFYKFDLDDSNSLPCIITNRHVVESYDVTHFYLHVQDGEGNPIQGTRVTVQVDNHPDMWVFHPDSAVDLCALPVQQILTGAHSLGRSPFILHLDRTVLPSPELLSELGAVEEVLMVGYPCGLWDSKNNLPIFRRGTTATHPNVDYEDRTEFMIDAACFPGSSGSPVLLYNMGSYASRSGVKVGASRLNLLGILHAGPEYTAEGNIVIVDVPTVLKPLSVSKIPMNLGFVIKASRLLDFQDHVRELVNNGRIRR